MLRYYAMQAHWKESGPPVYMAVAGYLGLISEKKSKDVGNLDELEELLGSGGTF